MQASIRLISTLDGPEADSWNCINNGVFLFRASAETRRYLGVWASVVLGRPAGTDQSMLTILLGLLPRMDYRYYAEREGLLDEARGRRARALGPLRTPRWGALEPRVDFAMPHENRYGGVMEGRHRDVAVFHVLESWPRHYLTHELYHDLRDAELDIVAEFLKGLSENGGWEGDAGTMELLARNERTWDIIGDGWHGGKRDCRMSYIHGR